MENYNNDNTIENYNVFDHNIFYYNQFNVYNDDNQHNDIDNTYCR